MTCEDFSEFQEYLKKSRDVDDKLIYFLNTTLPTDSFKVQRDRTSGCKDLYGQLQTNYKNRESCIKNCLSEATTNVTKLRTSHSNDPDNKEVTKLMKKEQTKIRLLQTELGVEEVVKNRSLKLFYERCRAFYKPENLSL